MNLSTEVNVEAAKGRPSRSRARQRRSERADGPSGFLSISSSVCPQFKALWRACSSYAHGMCLSKPAIVGTEAFEPQQSEEGEPSLQSVS